LGDGARGFRMLGCFAGRGQREDNTELRKLSKTIGPDLDQQVIQ
jgi:hypothetical protein